MPSGTRPTAAWKAAQRRVGARSVETVDLAGREAELGEAGLQGHDVVALDEVLGDVAQHAVAERPARTVEDGIRGASDDAVDDEPAPLLEGLDRLLDPLVVDGLAEAVAWPAAGRSPERTSRSHTAATAGPESPRRSTTDCWWGHLGSFLGGAPDGSRGLCVGRERSGAVCSVVRRRGGTVTVDHPDGRDLPVRR